jgi:hypothetical protein
VVDIQRFYITERGYGHLVTWPETEESGQCFLTRTNCLHTPLESQFLLRELLHIQVETVTEHIAAQVNNNMYFIAQNIFLCHFDITCKLERKAAPYFSNSVSNCCSAEPCDGCMYESS